MEELLIEEAAQGDAWEEKESEATPDSVLFDGLLEEATALQEIYPEFDLAAHLNDPLFKGLVSGEIRPNLRQVYELCHSGTLNKQRVEAAVAETVNAAVEAAVAEAVTRTVTETEQRMLSRIRARGQRPSESGLNAALGVRAHPAVGRLTRDDRERLARRASRGETIRL